MSDVFLFVLAVGASFRLWRLWAVDSLPPAKWVRRRVERAVHVRFGPHWAAGVTCPWCAGFWASVVVTVVVWVFHPLPMPGLWFAAVPTAVGLVAQLDHE